ncbi:MAG TPA: zinc-binding dehydrogenase [Anaerolineales bacterium]|nr:zinc-binding dehydrogenase [Anaerolineales bacterium]
MKSGNRFGAHRVIEPLNALPKAARRLDNQSPPLDNEIGIRVEALHITSTSFTRLWQEAEEDEERFTATLMDIVERQGKFQDPLTGSGGVLLGSVDFVGPALKVDLHPRDSIVTMVSLALTPLRIERVKTVNPLLGQVEVDGYAILFETSLWTKLPEDLPRELAMMALDVAGAPAYAKRYIQPGQRVVVIGGGKAGLLLMHEAKKKAGQVILVEKDEERAEAARTLGLADSLIVTDAGDGLEVMRQVEHLTGGALADVSFNCASLPDTEMSAILSTKDEGRVIFFSMSTDFSRAALGAEGAGKPVELIMGNGYIPGHAQVALQALRDNTPLSGYFSEMLHNRSRKGG